MLAAALATGVVTPSVAKTETCVKLSEVEPLSARLFQTELMVAALTCQRRQDYNRVIAKLGGELAARGKALKSVFKRLYGKNAEQSLNRFVTRLANEASLRSLRTTGYCDGANALFGQALNLKPHMLSGFVARQPFSNRHGLGVCEGNGRLSASR